MIKQRDSKQSIKVAIRVRPILDKQLSEDSRTCVKVEQSHFLHLTSANEVKKFTFDTICFNQSQQQIFDKLGKKCATDCLQGYNCTIFAYGQTGAGKTYTMMGLSFQDENYYENRGLIPRTIDFLFNCIESQQEKGINFIVRCSYLQIYNEQIIDLLAKTNSNLQLREDTKKGVYVQGITEQIIQRSEEAMQVLQKGSKARHISSTIYNETSSRSHSVFTLQIQSKYTKNGVVNTKCRQFHFIDLAGSQRTKLSTGQRLREGCNINKSLMNLSSVINALSEISQGKLQHINYRSSKLTFLLKDSLGGNSKTNLIANIHPATIFYHETLSTLGFARRAKLVKRQKALINQDSTGSLQSMKKEIKRLNQEIINYMRGSQQSSFDRSIQQKPMTSFLTQFVQEQIDKQTRFQVQILKLNDRIAQLQKGIKQYSDNQIHLRMVISVYEDKVTRLKKIQQNLNNKIHNLDQNNEQSKAIIEYFKNERNSYIKLLESANCQAENNKYMKQLLKEAKIMKNENDDGYLKDLLLKNTNYLTTISSKLNEMKPERTQVEQQSQMSKKMAHNQAENSKRQQQLQQRLDQANLELSEYKDKFEENLKLLEEAINAQIMWETNAKLQLMAKQKLQHQMADQHTHFIQCKARLQSKNQSLQACIHDYKTQVDQLNQQIANYRRNQENSFVKQSSLRQNISSTNALVEQLTQKNEDILNKLSEITHKDKQTQCLLVQRQEKIVELTNLANEKDNQNSYILKELDQMKTQIIKIKQVKQQMQESLIEQTQKYRHALSLQHAKHKSLLDEVKKQLQQKDELKMALHQQKQKELQLHLQQTKCELKIQQLKNQQLNKQNYLYQSQMKKLHTEINDYLVQIQKLRRNTQDLSSQKERSHIYQIEIGRLQQMIDDINNKIAQLTTLLQCQRQTVFTLKNKAQRLNQQLISKYRESSLERQQASNIKNINQRLTFQLSTVTDQFKKLSDQYEQLSIQHADSLSQNASIKQQLNKSDIEISQLSEIIKITEERQYQSSQNIIIQKEKLAKDNRKMASQLINSSKLVKQLTIQSSVLKEKLGKYEIYHHKTKKELDQLYFSKQKWQLQIDEMDKLQSQVQQGITSKQKIYKELCKQKEDNLSMKHLIQKLTAQNNHLQHEIQQKATTHQRLIEKCASHQKENRKSTSSEHYLKTIQLLDKSRSEQIQLRRQNDQLKKVLLTLKESIMQKETQARENQQKYSSNCDSLQRKLDLLEKDHSDLQKNYQKLIKQKKHYEKFTHDNEILKEQIRNLKSNASRIAQKNEQIEVKIKKANLDSIKLQKQYEQIKKSDSIASNNEDKNAYIHRLKVEIASLKTQRHLLAQSINKEREQKAKLKSQIKSGCGDAILKLELQKKFNENKNLTQLIFQIINQLKICVNEPKTKLQTIRNLIFTRIKQKFDQIKALKQKIKQKERTHYRQESSATEYSPYRQGRQLKSITVPSNTNKRYTTEQSSYNYDKVKDSYSYMKSFSSQSMRDYDKFNAKLKYNQNQIKRKMFE